MTVTATNLKFITGKTYTCRSICDSDTIFSYEIISRSAKTMMIRHNGKTKRRGIYIMDGEEHCRPDGTFSMCPVIRASSLKVEQPDEGKKLVGFIDMTPTWEEQMRNCATVLMHSTNQEAIRAAIEEMERCGRIADAFQKTRAAKNPATNNGENVS